MTELPHALSADRAVRDRDARRRRRAPALLGAVRQRRAPSRRCSSTAGPAAGRAPTIAASSTRRNTTSCCSTSAAAGVRRRTPASRPTRPGTWSTISSGCGRWPGSSSWLVFGGSWGSTLSLAYAQTHPERVTELVLRGIFLFDQYEIDWLYKPGGASELYPDKWDEFVALIPDDERGDLVAAYRRRLTADDRDVALAAAQGVEQVGGRGRHPAAQPQDDRALHRRRLRHRHRADRKSLHGRTRAGSRKASCCAAPRKLRGIPGVIVQGRHDCCTPPRAAWALKQGVARGRAADRPRRRPQLRRAGHPRRADPRHRPFRRLTLIFREATGMTSKNVVSGAEMNLSWGLLHAGLQTVLDTALDPVVVMDTDGHGDRLERPQRATASAGRGTKRAASACPT